jgi:hypothetical protein
LRSQSPLRGQLPSAMVFGLSGARKDRTILREDACQLLDLIGSLVVRIKRLRPSTFSQAIEMTRGARDSSV